MVKGFLLWLLLSLLFSTTSLAVATPDEVKWSRVNIPTEGVPGNWVLASGSDVQHLTMAIDGTLYAYGKGLTYTLYKSTNDGYSWSYTGKVSDNIVALATAPDDASVIYYATSSNIYKSTDAGNSFILLSPNPGGAGSDNVTITSIDVTRLSSYIIAVGTKDTDAGDYGGVYILDEGQVIPTWTDTNIGGYDVYAVAFSPNFPADRQLVAVVSDETNTIVTTKIGNANWGTTIGDATMPISNVITANIAFPDDYDVAHPTLFVAIDTGSGNGDVYRINGAIATDLNIGAAYGVSNIDVTGLAISGNTTTANILAGASGQVYISTDSGRNWKRSTKPPTGQSKTYVVMAADFADSGKAYAATSGTGSAFSITQDGGITWNQIGLIDTNLSTILDLAPSPNYSRDNTLFMLTWGGEHSLWRSLNGGTRWERVFTTALTNVDSIKLVELSPQYGNGSQVVFIAGSSNGNPAIWKSTDNGQNFGSPRFTRDPITATAFSINTLAVVNAHTLFVGSFDGSNGLVYYTTNSGFFYSTPAVVGSRSLISIALSPNYEQDETILVSNTNGWVYWSYDNGISFQPLPLDATSPPFTGAITVAFDPQYSRNQTVYAASSTAGEGIYRFIIGTSTNWERINAPDGGMIGQLIVSTDGTLYATNFKAGGGMERSLNPTYPLAPTFETVTRGLDDGATLTGLWLSGNRLWSIDTINTRLMTFTDRLTLPVTLTSPPNKAPGIGTIINYTVRNISLDWEALNGATNYKWQLDHDPDFSSVLFEDSTRASSARLPALEPATTYYWRVRATEPVLSPWSAKWSFTTPLGIGPKLYSPKAGDTGVQLRPLFQWSKIAGADSYELLVATDASLANPVIIQALPSTAWQCDIELDYNTTYYWKVRAIGSDTYSAWSAVGAFTTESPPEPSVSSLPTPSLSPEPSPIPQPVIPDWVKWLIPLAGGLLLIMAAMLITLIILTVKLLRL